MRTVICTPYRSVDARRDRLWEFTRGWIADHYPYEVFVGDHDGPFSRARARNLAAAAAGDWDIAIFHDADTLAHPEAIEEAIDMAAATNRMVVAGDSFMYVNEFSTNRILDSGVPMFARPASFDEHGIYSLPCSGVFAVSRKLFDAVGGYVENLHGWGYEDLIFLTSCGIFGEGNAWVPHHILLHLWHEPSPRTADTARNKALWEQLANIRNREDTAAAVEFLTALGHEVGR
ncbi:glycosyltransferase [Mycobacterium phage Phrappuccino]|uniref:Glycosyltransferase n=1 Tax=Mycobacterium phage Phrappuccino TaxID=2591223 RepID=A0A514DDZ8_9CAUD|nr:galactosyl transferase [Mycobacterium phage Phrappuccino]QDH91818.1 glycosyltransferase [Mycobacterium phage Phrappuccino]QIQ63260.1 glycosyltransferase [Mycobacterium phage Settecandela]